ncbi:MAG: DEAD/DEAH box helicase [Bacteroidetes bacterium]|nr:DEAD/DEAH box helicase [Bacteroidota bacterium]
MEEQHAEGAGEKPAEKRVRFDELDLHPDIEDGLWSMGFETATPIQGEAIPHALKKKDILGIAQTGTGKTAAFLLPTMDRIMDTPNDGKVKALIVVPTRELAIQIDQAAQGFAYYTGITSLAIYGGGTGKEFAQEKTALTQGADIIVVTPGRMLSHLTLGYVDLSSLEVLILDEADRMLDMGFHQDIMRIASHCRKERQTLLFSATMPDRMRTLAHDLLRDPVTVQLALSKPAAKVKQGAYVLFDHQKDAVLVDVLKERNVKSGIVFTSRKRTVGQVVRALRKAGINCGRMSSDLEQSEREEVMLAFRQQKLPILVATDVVSRGIDIDSIELVVNYDVPPNEEDYVHRIGRTARAERKGEAITLVTPDDMRRFGKIEKLIEKEVPKLKVPDALGAAPDYDPKSSGSRGGGGGRDRGQGGGRGQGGRRDGRNSGGPGRSGGSGGPGGSGNSGGGKRNFRRKGKPGGRGPQSGGGNKPS